MLKISLKKQLAIGCVTLIVVVKPVVAKEIVEVNRKFVWVGVSGTLGSSELENPQSDLSLHYINTNNVVRRNELVVFEVITSDARYLRIEGNCQTKIMHELYMGEFESENQLTYINVEYPWRKVNELEQKLLKFACNIK